MITKKLLEFQKLNIVVEKVGENPHFKSSYATLNEVLAKVKGPLNDLGVVIVQRPGESNVTNVPGLLTQLIDTEDDTRAESFMPYVGADTAQKLGSANTYCRRYSLVTLLGLEDADDDGEEASKTLSFVKKDGFAIADKTLKSGPVERNDEPLGSKSFPTNDVMDILGDGRKKSTKDAYPEGPTDTAFDDIDSFKLD